MAREINGATDPCRLPEVNGVVVVDVMANSPAAKGGLKPCDLIERGGSPVKNPSEVQLAVDRGRVGNPSTCRSNAVKSSSTLSCSRLNCLARTEPVSRSRRRLVVLARWPAPGRCKGRLAAS